MKIYPDKKKHVIDRIRGIFNNRGKNRLGRKQNTMVTVDSQTQKIKYNPDYHMHKQFSYYIQSGASKAKTD